MAHRFPAVAKLLTDQLVVRLLKENRDLKLVLFWKTYNYAELCDVMKSANQKYKGPDCKCLTCDFIGRMDDTTTTGGSGDDDFYHHPAEGYNCLFKIYFEKLIADCGMTFTHRCFNSYNSNCFLTTSSSSSDNNIHHHPSMSGGCCVSDVDTHFVDTSEHGDWENFLFGAKVWKARSVEDPELRKLVLLFHNLQEDFQAMELLPRSPGNHAE